MSLSGCPGDWGMARRTGFLAQCRRVGRVAPRLRKRQALPHLDETEHIASGPAREALEDLFTGLTFIWAYGPDGTDTGRSARSPSFLRLTCRRDVNDIIRLLHPFDGSVIVHTWHGLRADPFLNAPFNGILQPAAQLDWR